MERMEVDYTRTDPVDSPLRARFRTPSDKPLSYAAVGSSPQAIVAYPQEFSVAAGDAVDIRYQAELVQVGASLKRVEVFEAHTHDSLYRLEFDPGVRKLEREPCKSYYLGCDFAASVSVPTQELSAGLYYVFLTDDKGAQSAPVYFHVRPSKAELQAADAVILLSELTWHAYNFYGGGSLYGIQRLNGTGQIDVTQNASSRLFGASMRRPLITDPSDARPEFSGVARAEEYFSNPANANPGRLRFTSADRLAWIRTSPESQLVVSRYLRAQGKRTITISQSDIHAEPKLLEGVKLLIITGHNEYWTSPMIDSVTAYLKAGGRIANFSANIMWWQVNLESGTIWQDQLGGTRTPACAEQLPSQFQGTGLHYVLQNNAADRLFGVNYRFAHYPLSHATQVNAADLKNIYKTDPATIDQSKGKGVVVTVPAHPIYAGLGVSRGQRIGGDSDLLTVELDGVPLNPAGRIDRSFPNTFSDRTLVLATATTFVATLVNSSDGKVTYGGVKDVGLVVETQPFGDDSSARVISFGTIGYTRLIATGDTFFSTLLLNSVNYLSRRDLSPLPAGQ